LLDVGKIDRTRDHEDAVGSRVGNQLRFADDQTGFELTPARGTGGRRLYHLTLRVDLGRLSRLATGLRRIFVPLIEQSLQCLDDFFRVGALQRDPFGDDFGRRHIDQVLQIDQFANHRNVFGDQNSLHIRHGRERCVRVRRADGLAEELDRILRREVIQLHEIADDLFPLREQGRRGIDGNTLRSRELGWSENFRRVLVDFDKSVAVEQERRLDQADGFAARNVTRNGNGQRGALGHAGIADQALAGQRFIQAENFGDRTVLKVEADGLLGHRGNGWDGSRRRSCRLRGGRGGVLGRQTDAAREKKQGAKSTLGRPEGRLHRCI